MKLRINQQSIRLRLSQSDITSLRSNDRVSAPLYWGLQEHEVLFYHLTLLAEGTSTVSFNHDEINISILKSDIVHWLNDDSEVSFEFALPTLSNPLKILIERDFKCLTPRSENEDDLFQNPNLKC